MRGDFIKAKVAFGELTLGEVYDIVGGRCSHIGVEENQVDRGTYGVCNKDDKGLYLYIDEDATSPDYTFDATIKVKVKDDHVEFKKKGSEVSLYFIESRPIRLSSLLPRRS
jgi:hypothetical protein